MSVEIAQLMNFFHLSRTSNSQVGLF